MRHFDVIPMKDGSFQLDMSFKPSQESDLMNCFERLTRMITHKSVKIEATLNRKTGSAIITFLPQE